jgi:type 1 glutamine amidotransferase
MHSFFISLTAAAALLAAGPQEKLPADSIRVLLVTGVDYAGHRWKQTAPAIRAVLEQDKRFDVRIVEDPEFLASAAIFDYDVLFLHFKNYQPVARAKQVHENLVNFVKQGKGLVLLHFACGAFEDWPEFRDLAGRVWNKDQKSPHDPRAPFMVHITAPEHPLMRGMQDFQADDELYTCLVGERPVEVLATARSKVTGKDQPMAFVFDYGQGRVFHTPLGHDVKAIELPGVAELLRRGCRWVAHREP